MVLVTGFGCTTPKPELKPNGKVTVVIDPAAKPTRAQMKIGNQLALVLPAPKPAGYRWQIMQHNSLTLKQLSEFVAGPNGEQTISFMALRGGQTRMLFA